MFTWSMLQETTCCECNYTSPSSQTFQDIGIDISKANTVDEAFALFFQKIKLDDHLEVKNNYMCHSCEKKVEATQQWSILKAPPVIAIYLKRFDQNRNKIDKRVRFPTTLNLTPYLKNSTKNVTYNFCSLISHLGRTSKSGHYTSICKSVTDNHYFLCNDQTVTPVPLQRVLDEKNAYVLFYQIVPNCPDPSLTTHENPQPSTSNQSPVPNTSKPSDEQQTRSSPVNESMWLNSIS